MVTPPADYQQRERFAGELDRNFSVVAAAGSGKTYAITERIVRIASATDALEILPKLVVVTFTNRAADEMQQRTRQRILDTRCPSAVQTAFNSAFFGTIHSFCAKLLASYGHYIGLPSALELVTDDAELWNEFVQQHTHLGSSLSEENRAALFRVAQARQIMELARNANCILSTSSVPGPCPKADFAQVYAAVSRSRASDETIATSKAELAEWERRYDAGWEFVRWPVRSTSAKEFTDIWQAAFGPLRKWVADAALCVAAEVQRAYRDFRLEHAVVTYADQVALADELLRDPVAARRIREENFRVVLDEAQDTDPAQFNVLTEITRPPDATGPWLETRSAPPRAGHFCMVGDFQQSIYHDRADLEHYRKVHRGLLESETADELKFSVTFRLDQRQVDFVNETFREILNDKNGQVAFVELEPRPDALPGQIVRLRIDPPQKTDGETSTEYEKARIEAKALAAWIRSNGFEKLNAQSWTDVAILCPRKLWLRTIARALRAIGIPATTQSESELRGDNPAYAWLTALCTIMVDPRNSYEVVGVVREVFGVSDHDLAVFSEQQRTRFHIDAASATVGVVSTPLRLLAETRDQMQGRALFDALNILVERSELRGRLASLPREDFPQLERDLDALLARGAAAESEGQTLTDFAATLRANFAGQRESRLVADEGIQLITAQKAKGLEWQAVILPFLGRRVITPAPRYPCVLKVPGADEPLVALNKDDFYNELREATDTATEQEMARLLYVAATRARHTLVLVHDRELFANTRGAVPSTAQLKHFGSDKQQAALFEKISTTAEACPLTLDTNRRRSARQHSVVEPLPRIEKREQQAGTKRAENFVHKINPSAYEPLVEIALEESAPAIRLHSQPDNLATLYGRWWHTFFQTLDWPGGLAAADNHFQQRQQNSPRPERSAKEWQRVRRGLFVDDSTALFRDKGMLRHSEFPFLWRSSQRTVIEGIIDLLIVNADQRRCTLIDWKTNDERNGELLRARYLPQISAYWKAVVEITGFDVDAALFSTALGELLSYERAEVAEEWARLQALPPNELNVIVAPGVEAEV